MIITRRPVTCDPDCEICKGTGLVGTYYHAIDDNDVEICSCVETEVN